MVAGWTLHSIGNQAFTSSSLLAGSHADFRLILDDTAGNDDDPWDSLFW
jgi:hypothetical protein